jgi:hypothetical protein
MTPLMVYTVETPMMVRWSSEMTYQFIVLFKIINKITWFVSWGEIDLFHRCTEMYVSVFKGTRCRKQV